MDRGNPMFMLTLLIGTIIGAVIVIIIVIIKNKASENKANRLILNAQKEAEKKKRDSILEIKEES